MTVSRPRPSAECTLVAYIAGFGYMICDFLRQSRFGAIRKNSIFDVGRARAVLVLAGRGVMVASIRFRAAVEEPYEE